MPPDSRRDAAVDLIRYRHGGRLGVDHGVFSAAPPPRPVMGMGHQIPIRRAGVVVDDAPSGAPALPAVPPSGCRLRVGAGRSPPRSEGRGNLGGRDFCAAVGAVHAAPHILISI